MNESLNNLATIRQYLLGRVSDETSLEGIEELLFSDDEFCTKTEIVEDELINDYVFGKLDAEDKLSFEKTLENNADRRAKVKVTQLLKGKAAIEIVEEKSSIFDSLKAFFRQPIYAGGVALVLIAILIGAILLSRSSNNSELTELKNIYKNNRPTESRISEFEYAPLIVTRGSENQTDEQKRQIRLIETKLLELVQSNPNAKNQHALGIFYLTQNKFAESIKELEAAVKLDEKNPNFRNDLGSAYFEFGKFTKEKQFEYISKANEEFAKAIELNPNFLTALFNRGLALQELSAWNQAKEAWNFYLQKDSTSKWSDEARKNLEKIEQLKNRLGKNKNQILNDFWKSYRAKDDREIWKIHNSTKGTFTGISPFEQLTEQILLARKNKDDSPIQEAIEALNYIGKLEKERNADFFFADLADYYSKLDSAKAVKILEARDLIKKGRDFISQDKYSKSIKNFEKSRAVYQSIGNKVEQNLAEVWFSQMLSDVSRVDEAIQKLMQLADESEKKNYKVIQITALEWLANAEYKKSNFSKTLSHCGNALEIAEETQNIYQTIQMGDCLAGVYLLTNDFEFANILLNKTTQTNEIYFQNTSQFWRIGILAAELAREGENLNTSVDLGKETISIAIEKMPGITQVFINSIRELTASLIEKKEFEQAISFANEAVERSQKMEESPEKQMNLADSFYRLANVKRFAQKCSEALTDFDKSLELYAQLRGTRYNLYDLHRNKLICLQQLKNQSEFEKQLEIVLQFSEELRQNIKEDELRQSFFDNEQEIVDLAVSNAVDRNEPQKAFELLEKNKGRSLLDFVKSEKTIAEVEKDFATVTKPYSLSEIQEKLADNVQIVEYSVLKDKLLTWVITKTRFDLTEKKIEIGDFENKLNQFRKSVIEKSESVNLQGRELYDLLIPQNLEKNKIICLILDKSLHQIPFNALISSENKYLIEDFSIINSPSSSVFLTLTENGKNKTSQESLLSIGNPNFNRELNRNLSYLPEAEIEAQEVAKIYENARKFVGSEATKISFLDNFEKNEIIHFAGHYVADQKNIANSRMLFSDNDLHSFELSESKMTKAKLVVLSACETGFERLNKSEGSIGIARTFLALGAPLVVASNWKVDSVATQKLMTRFHQKRKMENLKSSEAIRQAQIEMLKSQELNHPFYWSAFSVTGGLTSY